MLKLPQWLVRDRTLRNGLGDVERVRMRRELGLWSQPLPCPSNLWLCTNQELTRAITEILEAH